ncbi:glycosyltransferase family 2 protein [Paenibacillus senegalensis]|uniref:glycosyltransferase family 2 protein n=1 Tax=Paenibacillus senegalensis TaxID=1465766 RepID=UPI001F34FF02|nr:glycosyltransferase [Paenibacillus senegalensis]
MEEIECCLQDPERSPYFITLMAGDRLGDAFANELLRQLDSLPDTAAGLGIEFLKDSREHKPSKEAAPFRPILWKTSVLAQSFPQGFPGYAWQPFKELMLEDLYRYTAGLYHNCWHSLPSDIIKPGPRFRSSWNQEQSIEQWVRPILEAAARPPTTTSSSSAPLITIALCVYNGERYLPWAIRSVLAQTMKSWELIIVDDGSTDGTKQAASAYLSDSRIRWYSMDSNCGKARCLNESLDRARGKWFMELDADDWLSCNALELITRQIAKPLKPTFLYSDYAEWKEKAPGELKIQHIRKADFPISKDSLLSKGVPLAPRVYHTATLRKMGGWQLNDPFNGRLYEDFQMILRILDHYEIEHLPAVLYHRRIRRESISQTNQRLYQSWVSWIADQSF